MDSEVKGKQKLSVQPGDMSGLIAAAHELKSPLVLIRQLSFALADESLTASRKQELLQQLTLVTERGLRLTTDLTRTARLEDSLFDVEPVNAQQLCEAVVRQISPLYAQYGRSIRYRLQRTKPLVLAHRELLSSVVYHFADNALHYGDDGSLVEVSMRVRSQDKTLRIGVRDKGPAMSLTEWRKIQRDTSSGRVSTRPLSSGLGLRVAEQFSAAMGGAIGLTRHRDGVTFYVDLPISEQLSLL